MTLCLFTRPEHDDTTYYLSGWCKTTIDLAKKKGFDVIDLRREKANRAEFEGRLKRLNPALVVMNGHGGDSFVAGHGNEPLVSCGENEELLKSRIVYAVSCRSAKVLGPKSIRAGAVCYTGYDDDFIFVFTPEKSSRPLQDETARLFLEPSALFAMSLVKGNSVGEARKKSEELLKKNFTSSLAGDSKDADVARFLWWDLSHFVSHGNAEATIHQRGKTA